MSEKSITKIDPIYLFKIIFGLILVGMIIIVANLVQFIHMEFPRQLIITVLVLAALGLIPFIKLIYARMDELQKILHQIASVNSMSIIISVSGIIGILQASKIIQLFNQLWTLVFIIAIWGINLMLSDKHFK